jgi:hypothetical protein
VPLPARDYEGADDLRLMQELAAECWRLQGPFVDAHVGDLPWRMYQHLDKLNEVRVRLWLDDAGRARAWAWLWPEGELDFQLHPDAAGLLGEVLEWFESTARQDVLKAWALEAHDETVAALEAAGYVDEGSWYEHMLAPLDDQLARPVVPDGYELRTVRGDEDVEARVEVHRAALRALACRARELPARHASLAVPSRAGPGRRRARRVLRRLLPLLARRGEPRRQPRAGRDPSRPPASRARPRRVPGGAALVTGRRSGDGARLFRRREPRDEPLRIGRLHRSKPPSAFPQTRPGINE